MFLSILIYFRDHLFLPQVLFICGSRGGGGRGVEASENGKLEEKGGWGVSKPKT